MQDTTVTVTGQLTVSGMTAVDMFTVAETAIAELLVGLGERISGTVRLDGLRRQSATTGWVATAIFTSVVIPEPPTEPEVPVDPEPDPEPEPEPEPEPVIVPATDDTTEEL